MSKTPLIGPIATAIVLAVTSAGSASTTLKPVAPAHGSDPSVDAGFNALDGRRVGGPDASSFAGGVDNAGDGVPTATWDAGPSGAEDSSRPGLELGGLDTSGAPRPLPLGQFTAGDAKAPAAHGHPGIWDFVTRIRYGGLPEPASWALMVLGFGMIGGALRGFFVASRRMARLQPEDQE